MAKFNSKQKGGEFERLVCKLLSLWVTDGGKTDVFWRSAMSGGRASVAYKNSGQRLAAQSGDISAVQAEGNALISKFFIECKHYKKLEWECLLYGGSPELLKMWNKVVEEANKFNKLPVMLARQNGREIVMLVRMEDAVMLASYMSCLLPMCIFPQHNMIVLKFGDFLMNPYKTFEPFLGT